MTSTIASLLWLCFATTSSLAGQATMPPRDGEVRVQYHQLQNITTVWLTLEPKGSAGKPVPPMMLFTLNYTFPGKRPLRPPTEVLMHTYAGLTFAPRPSVIVTIDDEPPVELASSGTVGLTSGSVSDFLPATVSISMLERIASARRVAVNALGVELELGPSQRAAIKLFLERILSDNPGSAVR
jgi:hypothetical protein